MNREGMRLGKQLREQEGEVKFILATSVHDAAQLFFAADFVGYHRELIPLLPESDMTILGGGWMNFNPRLKIIKLFGTSTQFGKADFEIAKELLQKEFSDFKISIEE